MGSVVLEKITVAQAVYSPFFIELEVTTFLSFKKIDRQNFQLCLRFMLISNFHGF